MLSFIVPVYKPKRDIFEKCVKSLLVQSLKDWEAVFVLDGPDTEAADIIHRLFKKSPNHYKVLEINHGGACKARNAGFEASKGEQVIFWDCDSLIEPHAAKMWVDTFEKEPETGFIYSAYKFLNEKGSVPTELWDPWLLKVRNFITTCSPVRRTLVPGWDESLESLQDWDFWLSVTEKAQTLGWDIKTLGKYKNGFSFSTAFPDLDSISGKGCTPEAWLGRVKAVKSKHGLADREICVSAIQNKPDGIRLAKLIDADYQDFPTDKPHEYKKIIQIGFSFSQADYHARIFNDPATKKFLFWTGDNILQAYERVSFKELVKYRTLLNSCCTQYVEDKAAKDMMETAGFNVFVLPLPIESSGELKTLPTKPRFMVDVSPAYGAAFEILNKSLPDIEIEPIGAAEKIEDVTGLIHFYEDRTMNNSLKRAFLSGRHVISNVRSPYAGYVDDSQPPDTFIPEMVEKIRKLAREEMNLKAIGYYSHQLTKSRLVEALK